MKKIIAVLMIVSMMTAIVGGCGNEKKTAQIKTSYAIVVDEFSEDGVAAPTLVDSDAMDMVEVQIPKLAREQQIVMDMANQAVKAHANAMIWTEKLSRAAEQQASSEEFLPILDNCVEAWRIADALAARTESAAELLEQAENLPQYQGMESLRIRSDADGNFYAAANEDEKKGLAGPFCMQVYAAEKGKKIDAKTWAANITKMYDEGKNGQKLKHIANMLGLNGEDKEARKEAYKALQTAQGIMKGVYEGEQAEAEASYYDNCYKTAAVLKTTGKVAVVVAGVAATGGSAAVGLMEFGGVAVDGVDALLDIADTGAMLILGEDNKVSLTAQQLNKKLAPVSAVLGGASAAKNLIGFKWGDGLKQIKGGMSEAGKWDTYTTMSYLGQGLYDLIKEGNVLGGAITVDKNGKVKTNVASIYASPKSDEEKAKALKDVRNAGFSDETIKALFPALLDNSPTESAASSDTAGDAAEPKLLEELTPEALDEVAVMTDVISEQNNPEKTVDDLAKEMKDILEKTYDIVVENPLTVETVAGTYAGTVHFSADFTVSVLGETETHHQEEDDAYSFTIEAAGDNMLRLSENEKAYATAAFDPATGVSDFSFSEKGGKGTIHCVFEESGGNIVVHITVNSTFNTSYGSGVATETGTLTKTN